MENEGLAAFMRVVDADLSLVELYERNLLHTRLDSPVAADFDDYKLIVGAHVSPLLLKVPSRWSQRSPYNRYCFTADDRLAYAGCSAVAIGMIMSYYSWSSSIDGEKLNWNLIKQSKYAEGTALLIAHFGWQGLVGYDLWYNK